jgi:predicted nucleotidyltransferase
MPLTMPPWRTTPSISEMTAVSRGLRASNSSTTRGRPPVMSLVLVGSPFSAAIAASRKTGRPAQADGMMLVMSLPLSIDRAAVSVFCQRHHIARLALFGSVLRDDFGPDSDIDVLVEFQPGHVPGLKFMSIEREFSGLVQGRRVDMVTPKFLNARIREQIVSGAEPLYVAA